MDRHSTLRTSTVLLAALVALGGSTAPSVAAPFTLQRTWTGEASLDQFGIGVAGVGDFDADGYDDVVVGANVHDGGALSAGRAYLFGGATPLPTLPAAWLDGSAVRAYLGQTVAGGGDFDGDGHADVAIGAPGPGEDGTRPGTVFLLFGGPGADLEPDLRLDGIVAGGHFGAALALDGDLDGDGLADLVIGAPRAGDGEIAIVRGRRSDGTVIVPDQVLSASAIDGDRRYGAAVATLADTNGDGRDELLIGAPRSSRMATWAGAVFVHLGADTLAATPDLVWLGTEGGEEFGSALATGGDLDGDGHGDVAVGAPFANAGGLLDAGRVAVFSGGPALDATADGGAAGEAAGDRFGTSLATGFDWDGDGVHDLAIGAPDHGSVATAAGAVYVFAGLPTEGVAPLHVERPSTALAYVGTSLANGGDLFGPASQGRGSVVAGGYDDGDAGRVLVFAHEAVGTDATAVPPVGRLLSPRPNPFNPRTTLGLVVDRPGTWELGIFDARGRRRATAFAGRLEAGTHRFVWDGTDADGRPLASGVYFVRARTEGSAESSPSSSPVLVRRIVLVR